MKTNNLVLKLHHTKYCIVYRTLTELNKCEIKKYKRKKAYQHLNINDNSKIKKLPSI